MSGRVVSWAMEQRTKSPITKLVLVKLAENSDDQGNTHPGIHLISVHTELSRSTVYKHLDLLERAELACRVTIRKESSSGKLYNVSGWRLAVPLRPPHGNDLPRIPPGGKTRPRHGASSPPDGRPYNEPSFKPSYSPPAYIAPPLARHVDRLRKAIGDAPFDAWFQKACFLEEGPAIALPSQMHLNQVSAKFGDKIREIFGADCEIRLAPERSS